jgi:hypothetical protein
MFVFDTESEQSAWSCGTNVVNLRRKFGSVMCMNVSRHECVLGDGDVNKTVASTHPLLVEDTAS